MQLQWNILLKTFGVFLVMQADAETSGKIL